MQKPFIRHAAVIVFLGWVMPVWTTGQEIPSYDFNRAEQEWQKGDDTTYVINFWATWCAPCVKELPAFEQLQKEYTGQKVKVILVSLDFPGQVKEKLPAFIREKKIQSHVIHLNDKDANTWIPKVDPGWSGSIPATLIVQPSTGNRFFLEKEATLEMLKTALEEVLHP